MDFPGGERKRRTNIRAQLKIRNIDFKKYFTKGTNVSSITQDIFRVNEM